MKTLIIILLLSFAAPSWAATEIVLRTKPSKTLLQAANQIKNWLNRSNLAADKFEDMLGDCMTPPVKSSSGISYVRILIPDRFLDNIQAAIPAATTCELVSVGPASVEIEPGLYCGEFAK